jgi:hypothetical protein
MPAFILPRKAAKQIQPFSRRVVGARVFLSSSSREAEGSKAPNGASN